MKILFLTNKFYPENNPQAILLRNILLKLSKYKNLNIYLLTTTKSYKKIDNINYKNYDLRINKIWKILDKLPFFNKYVFAISKYRKQLILFKKYILLNNIDIIVSFSNPYILNVLSHYLSLDLKIKNIIHYSDPVYKTIYKKGFYFFFRDFFLKFLEKKILLNATHIVVNNYQMAEYIFKNHNANFFDKTSIIPHSYNKDDYQVSKKKNKPINMNRVIFSFFGSLNKIRNPLLLIKAIIELKMKKLISHNVFFYFYGNLDSFLVKKIHIIKNLLQKNKIYFLSAVNFSNSIKKMFKSDILISIDAHNNENIYLTSKNIFYLPIKKPVLNITQRKSPNYFFGKKAGYIFSNVLDYKDLKKKILRSIFACKEFKGEENFIKKYSSDIVAKKWYILLNKIYI